MEPSGPSPAEIVHQLGTRLRLKVAERRRDLPWFVQLYEELRVIPGVSEVRVNPSTGSALVHFERGRGESVAAEIAGLPQIALESPPAALRALSQTSSALDAATQRGVNDLRLVLFLLTLLISVYQLSRGQYLAPALTLLLYGMELASGFMLERAAEEEPPDNALAAGESPT